MGDIMKYFTTFYQTNIGQILWLGLIVGWQHNTNGIWLTALAQPPSNILQLLHRIQFPEPLHQSKKYFSKPPRNCWTTHCTAGLHSTHHQNYEVLKTKDGTFWQDCKTRFPGWGRGERWAAVEAVRGWNQLDRGPTVHWRYGAGERGGPASAAPTPPTLHTANIPIPSNWYLFI